jgi:hypothetical protein
MRAVLALLALCGVAHADRWSRLQRLQGNAWLHYELSWVHDVDDTHGAPRATDLILAGARLHGFVGEGANIGYHAGIDLEGGATIHGAGFAYDVALFPIGIGVRLGETNVIAIGTGIEAMGAMHTLDDAVLIPVEAVAELGGGRARILARARAAWVTGAPSRHDGAPSLAFADELEATLGVRLGHHYDDYDFPTGNGYFAGATYRELLGTRFVGLVIGYSIDLGTQRHFLDKEKREEEERRERQRRQRRRRPIRSRTNDAVPL